MPTPDDGLVLSDKDGNYYVLPLELIELSKASPEAKSAIESLVKRPSEGYSLGGGLFFLGTIKLPEPAQWKHFTSDVLWPNGGVVPKNAPKTMAFGLPGQPRK